MISATFFAFVFGCYVPSPRFTVGEFDKLPELFTADYGGTFAVPSATATREGVPMQISVKVKDSTGAEVSMPGGVFDVSDLAGLRLNTLLRTI